MGMFRPDADAQAALARQPEAVQVRPRQPRHAAARRRRPATSAISSATGFISPNAVSFWTAPSTFWSNQPLGTPPSAQRLARRRDRREGRGGAAPAHRPTRPRRTSRNVLDVRRLRRRHVARRGASRRASRHQHARSPQRCSASATHRARPADRLGARHRQRRRRAGADDDAGDDGAPVDARRRAAFAAGGRQLRRLASASSCSTARNDGMLHAVNGNQTGTDAGNELWSFVPQEMFGQLNRLRNNSPEVRLPSTPAGSPATPRDYFVDGPIGVYQKLRQRRQRRARRSSSSAMRRGGRLLYAFDVTNPAAPQLLWKKTNADLPRARPDVVGAARRPHQGQRQSGAGLRRAATTPPPRTRARRARRRWATRSTCSTRSTATC